MRFIWKKFPDLLFWVPDLMMDLQWAEIWSKVKQDTPKQELKEYRRHKQADILIMADRHMKRCREWM